MRPTSHRWSHCGHNHDNSSTHLRCLLELHSEVSERPAMTACENSTQNNMCKIPSNKNYNAWDIMRHSFCGYALRLIIPKIHRKKTICKSTITSSTSFFFFPVVIANLSTYVEKPYDQSPVGKVLNTHFSYFKMFIDAISAFAGSRIKPYECRTIYQRII